MSIIITMTMIQFHWQSKTKKNIYILIFKIYLSYSLIHENTQRGERERQRHRQREKQAPCREPKVGLGPGTPGSCPGQKVGAKPLSLPEIPVWQFLTKLNIVLS